MKNKKLIITIITIIIILTSTNLAVAYSGETPTYFYNGTDNLTIIAFLESGNWTIPTGIENINIMVVAGGGAGDGQAGGGAGGLLINESVDISNFEPTTEIIIGAGGIAQSGAGTTPAENSIFGNNNIHNITAIAGGSGNGGSGGSGGGGTYSSSAGTGTTGQGNDGGAGRTGSGDACTFNGYNAGGGGGANETGFGGTTTNGGAGGDGLDMSSYFGTTYGESGYFAGGGGAGRDGYRNNAPGNGVGGLGGGGDGGQYAGFYSQDGTTNTGGGGGGITTRDSSSCGAGTSTDIGGDGGSGIIIISYTEIIEDDSTESTATVKQAGTVSFVGEAVIISSNFQVPINNTPMYGGYSFEVDTNNNNLIYCEMRIDGTSYANKTRSNEANVKGNVFTQIPILYLDNSTNHTQTLVCERTGGVGLTTISEAVGVGHFLVDHNNNIIPHGQSSFSTTVTSGASYTLLDTFNITTGNQTGGTQQHNIVLEGMLEYNNNDVSDEQLTVYATINDTHNCSFNPRDTDAGNSGSVSYDCIFENVTASTEYEIKLYGNGTNANYQSNIIAKDLYLDDIEIAGGTGILKGLNFTGNTDTKLINLTGGNLNHALTNVFQKLGYSILTDVDTTVDFYVKIINGETFETKHWSRGYSAGKVGFLIGHDVLEDVPIDENYQLELWANCGTVGATCIIKGGASLGYITDVTETILNVFDIYAYNDWNEAQILNFNATDGATYTTTNGHIEFFTEANYENITISSNGYIDRMYMNHNTSQTLNSSIYQSVLNLQTTEISTQNNIYNWTLYTEKENYNTTNGTVTLYPNLGNYIWNWTNSENYFNVSNISFTIDEQYENLTMQNVFARNVTFTDSLSSGSISPTCTQNGYSYSGYDYLMHKSTSELICSLFGYDNYEITNNTFPDNNNYELEPNALSINFSEQTSGIIQAGGESLEALENGDYFIDEFNSTYVEIPQRNISEGYVKITFNPDENNKYQQIYAYYNDLNTTVREDIFIQTVDLVQEIRVTGNTQAIENARVCAKYPNNEMYETTYCDFTGTTGDVNVQVNDQNTYLFCVQAEGYEPKCELHYIPPSNQELITINLISTEAKTGTNFIKSSCIGVYLEDKTCQLSIATYRPYYSICLNLSKTIGNVTTISETCSYDSISETFLYSLEQSYDSYNLDVYLSGDLAKTIKHINGTDDSDNNINYQSGNNDGSTILERIKEHQALLIFIHILLVVLGVLAGYMFDKYYNGYGVYGATVWFLFLSLGGFHVFWVPTILGVTYFIMEKVLPLFQN